MSASPDHIDPTRLFDAADAVLQAVLEVADELNGSYVHPPRLLGTVLQPECLCEFTRGEVEEATGLLVRLGVLPAGPPAA